MSRALKWLPWLAALLSLVALAASWNLPLLEAHGFRQTQTAISAYWMADGDWLAYPTPVLGAPWSLPFELPVFQLLALAAANVLPINLDQAGRLVSWLFLLATVLPLRHALRLALPDTRMPALGATLMLLSPLLVFWSRSFMIETCAVFFGVCFVALALESWQRPRPLAIAGLFASALLAALVKITTFFGYGLAAALLLAWLGAGTWRAQGIRRALLLSLPPAASVALALWVATTYLHWGDSIKAQSVWGSLLESKNLQGWNFGNWQQKTDPAFWMQVVFGRSAREILGSPWLLLPALAGGLCLARGRLRWFALGSFACYLAPMAVFTNLHKVHDYYQTANALFLVLVAACAVEAAWQRWGTRAGVAALALFVLAMLLGFRRDVAPRLDPLAIGMRTPTLAAYARAHTAPDDVILAFGLEWNSEVPYYATRRAMLVVDWVTVESLRRMRAEPHAWLGDHPLGLVIVCPNELATRLDAAADTAALLAETTKGRRRERVAGCDVYR